MGDRADDGATDRHDSRGCDPEDLARRFREFADAFPDLRLYHAISSAAARAPEVTGLLTSAAPGQARPVLLLAALHELVLRRRDLDVVRWYPSVTGSAMPEGDPWPDVRAACLEHADELRAIIASRSTQTNEVGRAAMLLPLLIAASADVPDQPVALVELGCSAGLLLHLDRYRVEVVDADGHEHAVLGDPASPVRLTTLSTIPYDDPPPLPRVGARAGIDAAPVSADDADGIRWLEACLWPDQPERIARFRAAISLARRYRPTVVAGDMVEDLERVVAGATAAAATDSGVDPVDVHVVVMCSWALTYVERSRRGEIANTLADLADDGRAVSWISAEPTGAVPVVPTVPEREKGDTPTVLGIRRWRDRAETRPELWAEAHPHGAWFDRSAARTGPAPL